MVNSAKLKNEFEKIAMEVCNNVGVDINQIIKHRHLSAPLQFIAGLGVRKSNELIERISHEMVGGVHTRIELFNGILNKTVYINCIGFIKIKEDAEFGEEVYADSCYDILDTTRIHPDCKLFFWLKFRL